MVQRTCVWGSCAMEEKGTSVRENLGSEHDLKTLTTRQDNALRSFMRNLGPRKKTDANLWAGSTRRYLTCVRSEVKSTCRQVVLSF